MPGTRESLGHCFCPARRKAVQSCSRRQSVPGTSEIHSGYTVRLALHCRAGKIVAQGHPFAVPAMAHYIFFSGRTISSGNLRPLQPVFAFCASYCRHLQKVQILPGKNCRKCISLVASNSNGFILFLQGNANSAFCNLGQKSR